MQLQNIDCIKNSSFNRGTLLEILLSSVSNSKENWKLINT